MHGTLSSTTGLAADLLDLLRDEQTRFDTFLELLDHERHALRALSSPELDRLNAAKLELLTDIQGLERRRTALVAALAAEWRVPVAALTLRAIADRVGGQAGQECRQRHERLSATLDRIREVSAVNGAVISRSLAFLDHALSLIRPPASSATIYSPSASLVSGAPDGALIERKG